MTSVLNTHAQTGSEVPPDTTMTKSVTTNTSSPAYPANMVEMVFF